MKRMLLSIGAILFSLITAPVFAQPAITSITPGAVAPGKTVVLTLSGSELEGECDIWTNFPAKIEIVTDAASKKSGNKIQCKVTLPADVPLGIGGLMVSTPKGVTDLKLLLIDDLANVTDNGKNTTFATAQKIQLPIAIDGAAQVSRGDFYKFTAKKGERISFEVVAQRLGSAFDGVMWLRDAKGKELVYNDDDLSFGADGRFQYTFATAGEYVLEIRDNRYQQGQRYRLRIGDFPLVSAVYPAGGQIGSTAQFRFAGPAAKGLQPVNVTIPSQLTGSQLTVRAKYPGGKSSGTAIVAAGRLPEVMESEPNNDAPAATAIAWPCVINGRLHDQTDTDYYEFTANKGNHIIFRGVARSLGSPSFVYVRLVNAAGKKIAETKAKTTGDKLLEQVIPATGVYRLVVEDRMRRGGPEFIYRIKIESWVKGFTLELKNLNNQGKNKFVVPENGSFAVDVLCKRNGYNGPITLSVEGAPAECQLRNNVIGEKKKETKLIVTLPWQAIRGKLLPLRIIGTAKFSEKEFRAQADTMAIVRTKMPELMNPPAWFDGLLAVTKAGKVPNFFTVSAPAKTVNFPRLLGETKFIITPKRIEKEITTVLSVLPNKIPTGYSIAVKTIGNMPAEKYEVTLTGPKNATDEKLTIGLVCYAEHEGRGLAVTTEVPVRVITPLTVSLTPAEPIAPGQKLKVKLQVVRFTEGENKPQPITIQWKKLPPGVTGAAATTIPADKNEIELELTAAADAKEVKFDQLTIQATTKFQDREFKLESKPAVLIIKKQSKPVPQPKPKD